MAVRRAVQDAYRPRVQGHRERRRLAERDAISPRTGYRGEHRRSCAARAQSAVAHATRDARRAARWAALPTALQRPPPRELPARRRLVDADALPDAQPLRQIRRAAR